MHAWMCARLARNEPKEAESLGLRAYTEACYRLLSVSIQGANNGSTLVQEGFRRFRV